MDLARSTPVINKEMATEKQKTENDTEKENIKISKVENATGKLSRKYHKQTKQCRNKTHIEDFTSTHFSLTVRHIS